MREILININMKKNPRLYYSKIMTALCWNTTMKKENKNPLHQ